MTDIRFALRSVLRLAILVCGMNLGASLPAAAAKCQLDVVYRSGSSAYEEALRGLRETVPVDSCRVDYIDLDQRGVDLDTALRADPKLVVAVGLGAYEQVRSAGPSLNILPALVLRGDLKGGGTAVYADVPLITILENLHTLFPKRTRVGLIRRPSWPAPDSATQERARQMGFELHIVECAGPDKLLAAFSSLKNAADFVIADPDPELYNSATLKPLVLASLDKRLPIAGFSAAFVHAGALVGVYPDFHELGRETGEAAAAILAGRGPDTGQGGRSVKVAVNQQIARLMGVDPVKREGVEVFK